MSGSSKQCECCGQPLPNKLGFTLDGGYLKKDGKRIRLSGQEYAMLEAVVDAHPRQAPTDYVIERVWPRGDEPETVDRQLWVLAHRIRKKTGVPVTGSYSRSFQIAEEMPKYTHRSTAKRVVTDAEIKQAQHLYDLGYGWADIGALVGRSHHTLRHHVAITA